MSDANEFIQGVVYAAAHLVREHGAYIEAGDILDSASINPNDAANHCAEYDVEILRDHVPGWEKCPRGFA